MNSVLYYVKTSKNSWFEDAVQHYESKLNQFTSFTVQAVSSPTTGKVSETIRKQKEGDKLLNQIKNGDGLIVFDERGTLHRNSRDFAHFLGKNLEIGKSRLVFIIGGAYGIDEKIKKKANYTISLGPLTFNHHLALLVALEQIYRGWTILKGHPYHHDSHDPTIL